jgi:hypothetical protein
MGSNAGRDGHTEFWLWLRGVGILCEAGTGLLIWFKFNSQVSLIFSKLFIQVSAAGSDNLIF